MWLPCETFKSPLMADEKKYFLTLFMGKKSQKHFDGILKVELSYFFCWGFAVHSLGFTTKFRKWWDSYWRQKSGLWRGRIHRVINLFRVSSHSYHSHNLWKNAEQYTHKPHQTMTFSEFSEIIFLLWFLLQSRKFCLFTYPLSQRYALSHIFSIWIFLAKHFILKIK